MVNQGQIAETLVLDASVAVKWALTDEDHVQESTNVLDKFTNGEINLVAPVQIRYEVPNAVTVAARRQPPRINVADARLAIEYFLSLGIQTIDSDDLIRLAFDLSQQYDCALYDGLYLALYQQLGIPLITADNALYQKIKQLPNVIWIADYQ